MVKLCSSGTVYYCIAFVAILYWLYVQLVPMCVKYSYSFTGLDLNIEEHKDRTNNVNKTRT